MEGSRYTSLGEMDRSSFFYTRVAFFIEVLELRDATPDLKPLRPWKSDLTDEINNLPIADLFSPIVIKDAEYAEVMKAGVLLWNDELELAQSSLPEYRYPDRELLAWHHASARRRLQQCQALVSKSR